MINYISLSYILSDRISAYGNGDKLEIKKIKSITLGDTSNNSLLKLSAHLGTHIDFPYHFCNNGKKSSDYLINELIFTKIGIIEVKINEEDLVINENIIINSEKLANDIDFLLIKTGYCNFRYEERYWKFNPGFHQELAKFLRKKFPFIRAIGFDSISLSSFQHREIGRLAHKEFLCINNILIVEDMDLSKINSTSKIKKLIIAPLVVQDIEAAPVTVIAELEND